MPNKIIPKQYAVLLYEITKDLRKTEIKEKISKFVGFLVKNNHLSLVDKIIGEFKTYTKKQEGVQEVELVSARPIGIKIRQRLINILNRENKIELKEKIDPGLLGGMVIKIGDTMIDGSIRRRLSILSDKLK
ncbi:MAG TPA: ATP synthase F1 subunit delta [Candidatus Nealsonbacteria bacterium]|uniref:ATP synthase subunit delta n=1 Tax=marine sediment metagenome TaxID=412755 RepID=A0A0F9XTR4_9ZZZZ|nr:ATP synthase F1 subunit delta [Candidatus Nealsonbacteria bacterium]HEB46549.1 ATP synthase F1 subunit delta [Candidatus Nealsonbacteria bacterium]